MSAKDLTKITLNNTKNFLTENKAEIYAMLKDPDIVTWQQINFEKNAPLLKFLGISVQALTKTLIQYPKSAKEISQNITRWNNEVGNQLADLLDNKNVDEALKKAQALETQAGELETLKSQLQQQISIFAESAQLVRHSLSLQAIIPLSEKSPGVKSNLFTSGLNVLSLVTDEIGNNPAQKNIDQISSEASNLATRFSHIEMPKVPRLAEEIIFHYISLGSSTTQEVITFISNLKARLEGEHTTLEHIKTGISELYNQDIETILQGLKTHAASLGSLICGLHHKRQLQKNMETIGETLELLNIYQLALKKKLIPALTAEIDTPASSLNPTSISAAKTKDFFLGAKGIIRSVKMMVTSLKGHEAINELELQIILETALNKCSVYYGKSAKDVKKLSDFIHGLIEKFTRPFPYEDLFNLTKLTISSYGTQIEHFIKQCEIPPELLCLTNSQIPDNFAGLIQRLRDKNTAFHKVNTGK